MSSDTLAGLSAQERQIFQHFTSIEQRTIRKEDIISLLECNPKSANQILLRLQSKGWLYRLKRGIYYIVPISSKTSTPALENPLILILDIFDNAFVRVHDALGFAGGAGGVHEKRLIPGACLVYSLFKGGIRPASVLIHKCPVVFGAGNGLSDNQHLF